MSSMSRKRQFKDLLFCLFVLFFVKVPQNYAMLYSISMITLTPETWGEVSENILNQISLLCLGARDKQKWSSPSPSLASEVSLQSLLGLPSAKGQLGSDSVAKLSSLMARLIWGQSFIIADLAKGNLRQEQICTGKFDVRFMQISNGYQMTRPNIFFFFAICPSVKWILVVC